MVESVEEGDVNPLHVYAELSILAKEITSAKEQIFQLVSDEADKHPEKTFELNGYEFTKKAGGGRYDYKCSGIWENKKKDLDSYQKLMQLSYKALQAGSALMVDTDGVEIPSAEYTPTKHSLSVKKIES